MAWKRPISKYRRHLGLRLRCQWARFTMQSRDDIILRWHGGTISELMAAWRNSHRAHAPFVAGFYTALRHRQRLVHRRLLEASR